MDIDKKIDIIKSEPTEEIVTIEDLKQILETNSKPKHYMGIEISGIPHIGHVFVGGKKINDLDSIGAKTNVLLADWHSVANKKLNGDWDKIKELSKFYSDLFKAFCPNVNIVLGSDLYEKNDSYWKNLINTSTQITIARATRTLIIQGRSEKDTLYVSQYIYPIMQAIDIEALDVDIPHAGIDQRRVHMLAKEIFETRTPKRIIAPLHHHLLPSLLEPPKINNSMVKEEIVAAMKMSKSKPGSAISILATDDEIRSTIKRGWCPERITIENPILELVKYVIIPNLKSLDIERKKEHGGDLNYIDYKELERAYANGMIHPLDLKNAVATAIIKLFKQIRPVTEKYKEQVLNLMNEK